MKKTTSEIKNIFFDFFLKKKHKIISGSSLIPSNDKTLLFTNAGMNQFKDIFLGKSHIDYPRIVTIQNCLRTGGKHNDLNNVGYTKYHHTFFEMLGNFSFGNYFKKEAIIYAWELLTNANWFHLDQNKLIVTVHNYDNETYDIWKNIIKIPKAQIVKTGNKHYFNENSENFWQMASTGPCGPCTEIFYNTEETLSLYELLKNFKQHQSKFIEIWNIVFMQFHRTNNGTLITLPKLSVDTGMGLERISAIIQKVHSNYEIDIFQALINTIYKLCNIKNPNRKSLQVISDHIRSSAFIIAENIIPSNDTRGYVLRKIIRRAMRFGLKLNIKIPFLYKLVPSLIKIMKHNNSI
ncbi:alanine--tRNA ligase, partial [Buchnera aphidicola (Hormaphis cornu)]